MTDGRNIILVEKDVVCMYTQNAQDHRNAMFLWALA